MPRDMLRVDGVSPETVAQLRESGLRDFGQANASLVVRQLIASHLAKRAPTAAKLKSVDLAERRVRVEVRLPKSAADLVDRLAEERFDSRQYYLTRLILSHLGQPQLHGDEIEVLRKSNYELAKIGTNLNQIAKAFNILAKAQTGGKLPEVGKRIAALRREISEHTNKVLRALESGTTVWEARGRGRGQLKKSKRKERE